MTLLFNVCFRAFILNATSTSETSYDNRGGQSSVNLILSTQAMASEPYEPT